MQTMDEPLVTLILKLSKKRNRRILHEFQRLIYQPFHQRFHPMVFELLPPMDFGVEFFATRQAYRLIAPLMAHYPQQGSASFPRALARLSVAGGRSVIARKLLIIRHTPKLHHTETTVLYLINQLKRSNIPINWYQMITDAKYWNTNVAERWLEEFYVSHN